MSSTVNASAQMPSLIYKAAMRTGKVSNTVYIQHAVCEALSRDLGIALDDLLATLPEPRSNAKTLFGPDRRQRPNGRVIQEVR